MRVAKTLLISLFFIPNPIQVVILPLQPSSSPTPSSCPRAHSLICDFWFPMERSSSNIRESDVPSSGWPSVRPSPLPTPSSLSELSPHIFSIHSASSPWSQAASRITHSGQPRKPSIDNSNINVNLRQFGDWASVFSAPLDPSLFATLAASGVLGQLPPFPEGTPSSLPSSSFNPSHSTSSSSSPTIAFSPQQDMSDSWIQPSTAFSYKAPLLTSKPSLPRSNTSFVPHLQMPKDKFSPCQFFGSVLVQPSLTLCLLQPMAQPHPFVLHLTMLLGHPTPPTSLVTILFVDLINLLLRNFLIP